MTGDAGVHEVAESVGLLRKVLAGLTMADAGSFMDRTGAICPYDGGPW